MAKKELLFFIAIIVIGALDWLTTVAGVYFFGATEINPLLSELTKSSMLFFSIIKLSAIVIAGFAFYKAGSMSRSLTKDLRFTNGFLNGGCLLTLFALVAVVTNNLLAVSGL